MAYETTNPVKKISQMGDSNSLWYYTDGDAIGTIDDNEYFLASTGDLNAGDVIFVNSWVECANYVSGGWSNNIISSNHHELFFYFLSSLLLGYLLIKRYLSKKEKL